MPFALLAARNVTGSNIAHVAAAARFRLIRGIDRFVLALIFVGVVGLGPFAANGVQMLDGERNRRRRCRLRCEDDLETVPSENFRRGLREFVRKKSAVETNNDFWLAPEDFRFGICDFRLPKIRRRLRDARDVREGKILRDDRAPAVRAKFDVVHAAAFDFFFAV